MSTDLIVVGTSGLAKEMAQLARQIDPDGERWREIRYCAQDPAELGRPLPFGRVCHIDGELTAPGFQADVVVGIGHPSVRRRVCSALRERNPLLSFPNLVCPGVVIDPERVTMGVGNVITRGVVMTIDIKIGDFNLVNWNATLGHDAVIGSYCVINPGAAVSGFCRIGDACLIGVGAIVLEHLSVCEGTQIGAGAVVTRTIDQPGTYVGAPARSLGR